MVWDVSVVGGHLASVSDMLLIVERVMWQNGGGALKSRVGIICVSLYIYMYNIIYIYIYIFIAVRD